MKSPRHLLAVKHYLKVVGFPGLMSAMKARASGSIAMLSVKRPEIRHSFRLRVPSTDVLTYEGVFFHRAYDFQPACQPDVIVDAGANIGLASIYFANRFPRARIIAIEPEESNYRLLEKNVAPYGNIQPIRAALWNEGGMLDLVDPGLGHNGFMTVPIDHGEESVGTVCDQVQAITIQEILENFRIDKIDILKIDIEGAEKEVFQDTSAWIGKVGAIIIELHERMKLGCTRSFYNGSNGFDAEWMLGENHFLVRMSTMTQRVGCSTREA